MSQIIINPYQFGAAPPPAPDFALGLYNPGDLGYLYNFDDTSTVYDSIFKTTLSVDGGVAALVEPIFGPTDANQSNAGRVPIRTFGAGLTYDGTSDYMNCRQPVSGAAGNGSICCYFRKPATGAHSIIFGGGTGSTGRTYLGVLTGTDQLAAGMGAVSFTTFTGGPSVISATDFHTGVLTWQGAGPQIADLYLDGAVINANKAWTGGDCSTNTGVGGLSTNSGSPTNFFAGDVKHAMYIDRILTPTEIADLHTYWASL